MINVRKKKDIQPESRKYAKLLQIWTSVSILLLVKVENLGPHLTQRFWSSLRTTEEGVTLLSASQIFLSFSLEGQTADSI